MKTVEVEGAVVNSPWLGTREAAAYCGLSEEAFLKQSKGLPYAGSERRRRYLGPVLDMWIAKGFRVFTVDYVEYLKGRSGNGG